MGGRWEGGIGVDGKEGCEGEVVEGGKGHIIHTETPCI